MTRSSNFTSQELTRFSSNRDYTKYWEIFQVTARKFYPNLLKKFRMCAIPTATATKTSEIAMLQTKTLATKRRKKRSMQRRNHKQRKCVRERIALLPRGIALDAKETRRKGRSVLHRTTTMMTERMETSRNKGLTQMNRMMAN